jgi:hypothetical protein
MIYLKINENNSIEYPYSIEQLKQDNINTSFTDVISIDTLNAYSVYRVTHVDKGNDHTKNYTEGVPVLINNQYYQNWIMSDASTEEIEFRINTQWNQIRSDRNQYLQQCDWTQLPDSPLTVEKKQEWATYRQSLRDVTNQEDPFNIIWPTKPQ